MSKLSDCLEEEERASGKKMDTMQSYRRELTESISKANKGLLQLRQVATPLHLNFRHLDLRHLMNSVVMETQPGLDFPISVRLPAEPVVVEGDTDKLADAFIELIWNSQQAMSKSEVRQIEITISRDAVSDPAQGWISIEVTDSGPGIREEDKERIFEPSYTTKARGSGLGLAIVRKTVNQHGGRIIENGKGCAHFDIRLPAAD